MVRAVAPPPHHSLGRLGEGWAGGGSLPQSHVPAQQPCSGERTSTGRDRFKSRAYWTTIFMIDPHRHTRKVPATIWPPAGRIRPFARRGALSRKAVTHDGGGGGGGGRGGGRGGGGGGGGGRWGWGRVTASNGICKPVLSKVRSTTRPHAARTRLGKRAQQIANPRSGARQSSHLPCEDTMSLKPRRGINPDQLGFHQRSRGFFARMPSLFSQKRVRCSRNSILRRNREPRRLLASNARQMEAATLPTKRQSKALIAVGRKQRSVLAWNSA